jgi:membrane protein
MRLIKRFISYSSQWWSRHPQATRVLPHHLGRAFANFSHHGARRAAALSYYAVFSVFPLTLLLAVLISSLLGPAVAQEQIATGLAMFLPSETVNLLQANLADALAQGNSFGLIAVAGLAWSALGLFSNISSSLDLIFEVPANRSLWRQRLLAFLMTIILIILVATSFVASGILHLFSAFLLDSSAWITIAITVLPLGLNMVIFALLFRYVPARRVHWDVVWPASIFGAIGWELAKIGFGWYVANLANFSVVYGGIATVIVLMLWAYLLASIFLLSAELCAQLDIWFSLYHDPDRHHILLQQEVPHLPPETLPKS